MDILGYTITGRVMTTLRRAQVMLSIVSDETSKDLTAGLQGVLGTEEEVALLVKDAIRQWRERPLLVAARDVRMLGMW